ncbi:MAG: alkaline phosphatase family protein [Microcella sp.]|uniref:alkaline phosphatase family protein n=1 Tax=Microcella sp. TaxID=1913979 RepID=UPI00331549F0
MLPAPRSDAASLADVLYGAFASLTAMPSRLSLPAARSAAVLLADGLGVSALRARAGHARRLMSAIPSRGGVIDAGFPTTTASALASLTTGLPPGRHGMVGYTVRDPQRDGVVQQLGQWPADLDPVTWQPHPTVFESARAAGVDAVVVAASRYRDTAFTEAVLRGARFVIAPTIAERVEATIDLLGGSTPALVYTYVPELDMAGHAFGSESAEWIAALEQLDAALDAFSRLPRDAGALLVADHGMIDVPAHARLLVSAESELWRGVRLVAGEPRCLQLHVESEADLAGVLQRWRSAEDSRAWVVSRDEAISAGWFGGTVDDEVSRRIGDVLVAARARVAYYDERQATARALAMVGQHGSLSPEEMRVPLARWGAFAH